MGNIEILNPRKGQTTPLQMFNSTQPTSTFEVLTVFRALFQY